MRSRFWSSFGPGLLWAAAAIGVSHLVQSTRAGAVAGFGLIGVVILANVLKYPFFEYGPRYAAATNTSLVEGYARIGRWALWLYLAITVVTSLIIQSAVVLFTAFVFRYVFGVTWSLPMTAGVLLVGCALLLWVGRFKLLDGSIKAILVLLAISSVAAAVVTLPRVDVSTFAVWPGSLIGTTVPLAFLLALMGWMPTAIDVAVWSSLWTLAKNEASGARASVTAARLDFFVGYAGTAILALAFLTLGAGVMFGSGASFSPQGTVFSTQLVELYVSTLGAWTKPIVLVAMITTMFSTTLTVVDGFPRAIERSVERLRVRDETIAVPSVGRVYWICILGLALLTMAVLALFLGNLTTMIDFATIVSFLTAPILGYLNLKAVTSPHVAPEHRPGPGMVTLSWVGLVLLGGVGIVYLVSLFP